MKGCDEGESWGGSDAAVRLDTGRSADAEARVSWARGSGSGVTWAAEMARMRLGELFPAGCWLLAASEAHSSFDSIKYS